MRKIITMLMVIMTSALALGSVFAMPGPNGDPLAPKVDQIFASYIQKGSPGANVLIMKDNRVIYQNSFGMANLEQDIPITQDTVFQVGSNSKQFTAFAILLLSAEGKLALDDDIHKYLPQIPDFGKRITIRNLLNHTSGLRDNAELMWLTGWLAEDLETQERVLRLACHQKDLNFDPGTQFLYSNTGYCLLAEIVAKVSGQTFAEFSQQRIFKPLGMKHTFIRDDQATTIKSLADSYSPMENQKGFQKCILSSSVLGSTNLFTTTGDLVKWIQNFETCQVGNRALLSLMQTPGKLNDGTPLGYAFGLFGGEYKGLKVVAHGGDHAGYHSQIMRFPEQRFAVAVLSNLDSLPSPELNQIIFKIADLYLVSNSTNTAAKTEFSKAPGEPEIYQADVNQYQSLKKLIAAKNKNKRLKNQVKVENETTPAQLTEYCGEYYSEELETSLKITLQDNQLIIGNLRLGDEAMEFTGPDEAWGGLVTFQRINNQIAGLMYNGSRVRNLRFVKVK